MPDVVWDDEMARAAEYLVSLCEFSFAPPGNLGGAPVAQNLFGTTSGTLSWYDALDKFTAPLPQPALFHEWWQKISSYTYATNSGDNSEALQHIFLPDDVSRVGCAKNSDCAFKQGGNTYRTLVFCFTPVTRNNGLIYCSSADSTSCNFRMWASSTAKSTEPPSCTVLPSTPPGADTDAMTSAGCAGPSWVDTCGL
eukprot:gene10776-9445_t